MKIFIPEIQGHGLHRLGRHVNHDPRSLRYVVPKAVVDKTVKWNRRVPAFDQGNLGSCTGNAEAGCLGTDPFFSTLPNLQINEDLAVKLYSLATKIDPYSGSYPPDDTGSDGLSVSKAAKQLGYISGYVHATSVDGCKTMIQQGPFIVGSDWTTNMDAAGSDGIIPNPAGGSVRGGHEYECFARDAEADLWWFWNSWGVTWGFNGTFAYNSAGLAALLLRGGDATQSVPITAPAPTPTPTPTPTDQDLVDWWKATEPWAIEHHSTHSIAGIAAHACLDLADKKGLR